MFISDVTGDHNLMELAVQASFYAFIRQSINQSDGVRMDW
jgi:hypothetical protein